MVAEMGMSEPGELGAVSRLGRPDVALYTNVRPAHLERFGTLQAIAEAKAELLEGLVPGGAIIANAADAEIVRIVQRHRDPRPARVVWYRHGPSLVDEPAALATADVSLGQGESHFRLVSAAGAVEVVLPLYGEHNVENFLAAATCAHCLGVPLGEIAKAAAGLAPVAGRGVLHRLRLDGEPGALLIDESYNSNPYALEKALAAARRESGARHWAVLGEMLELGVEAPRFHREAGELAARLGFSPIVGVGPLAEHLVAAARAAGAEASWVANVGEAAAIAEGALRAGDVLLVKGSRGVALDRLVASLLAAGTA
jgi:UDP-N-acetylmuramoyl-tripeptide--D-alanyl-D-alanine ligase